MTEYNLYSEVDDRSRDIVREAKIKGPQTCIHEECSDSSSISLLPHKQEVMGSIQLNF